MAPSKPPGSPHKHHFERYLLQTLQLVDKPYSRTVSQTITQSFDSTNVMLKISFFIAQEHNSERFRALATEWPPGRPQKHHFKHLCPIAAKEAPRNVILSVFGPAPASEQQILHQSGKSCFNRRET